MELVKNITSIEIPTNRVSYDKKSNVLSVEVLDFMFVGIYKKSAKISKILDDLYASLGEIQLERNKIYFIDFVTGVVISETEKLKRLKFSKREKVEKKEKKVSDERKAMRRDEEESFEIEEELYEEEQYDKDISRVSTIAEYGEEKFREEEVSKLDDEYKYEITREKEGVKAKKKSRSMLSPPGGTQPSARKPAVAQPPPSSDALIGSGAAPPAKTEPTIIAPEEPQETVYNINMGLQYYSVMMEQRSYLFYVYFSHKELKIVDEEGKTIYKTTIKIVTTKEEPPVLDLKIEGGGFEVHPIFGKVEVKKDAVNPPVMIFSIMPIKTKKEKKKKKESERRFLNVNIEFENKIISHTILSIIVQPKYFRLDIGPIHLNLSRKAAVIISFISILIAGISLVYMLLSVSPSSTFMDYLGGLAPGLGSIVFFVVFLYVLFKEGIFPLKQKISAFLNFDQTGVLIK